MEELRDKIHTYIKKITRGRIPCAYHPTKVATFYYIIGELPLCYDCACKLALKIKRKYGG